MYRTGYTLHYRCVWYITSYVSPGVLTLAVKLPAALRQVAQVVVQLGGAGVAAGPGTALPRVLHQEAVAALDVGDVGDSGRLAIH